MRAKGRSWFGEDEVAYRFNGTLQDITQARKAEEEKQKLATMVEASQEFITLASLDTSLQYANPAALQLLGWDAIAGKKMIECVYPPDQQLARQLLAELNEKGLFPRKSVSFTPVPVDSSGCNGMHLPFGTLTRRI